MKISKLFHWLYAILMLLPFAFFVPSVLYYAFNDNATMQSVDVPKTETLLVDFNQLVVNGEPSNLNTYTLTDHNSGSLSFNDNSIQYNLVTYYGDYRNGFGNYYYDNNGINVISNHKYYSSYTAMSNEVSYIYCAGDSGVSSGVNSRLLMNNNYQSMSYIFTPSDSVLGNRYFYIQKYDADLTNNYYCRIKFNMLVDLTQMFGSGNEPSLIEFEQMFPNNYYDYTLTHHMQITYNTGETEQLVSNTGIINYAWESIWDLPLFNWSKVSFVAVPFTYITGLFGLAPSNSFNYVFTYFASMSIIWLVFDVILYVPLLVHRWLDKGIVE